MAFSIVLEDFDPHTLASQVFERQAHEYFSQLPKPDPQYAVPKVAEILSLAPDTVREYLELPVAHPRRLPFVKTSDSARGNRVLLSDLTAWQQRNRPASAPLELPVRRPGRRRAA